MRGGDNMAYKITDKCISCGACAANCPVSCISQGDGKYVIDTENTTMVVKDSTGATITQDIPVTIDKTTGKITITVENVKKENEELNAENKKTKKRLTINGISISRILAYFIIYSVD